MLFPLLLLLDAGAAGLAAQPLASVQITRAPQGPVVPRDFMGLSLQQSFARNWLGSPSSPNTVLFTLLKNLGTGSLRIGGAAADYSCWNGQPAPLPSICQYTLTSDDFHSWAFASAQTAWPMVVGVNLAQNKSSGAPQYILEEIRDGLLPVLASYPTASLLALELGNELNLYRLIPAYRPLSYGLAGQIDDLLSYITMLKGDPATRNIPLAAPAYYNPSSGSITSQLDPLVGGVLTCDTCSTSNLGLVTLHEYPLSALKGNVTVAYLMSPALIQSMQQIFQKAVLDMYGMYGLSVQIGETNSAVPDPGQSGVSDVQASALWALDYALAMARSGVRRMNFHMHDGSYYDPIAITSLAPGVFSNQVQPEYYAMYAFNAAKNRRFLPVTVTSSANIRAYALSQCSTCAITVYLINKDLSASGAVQISLSAPAASAAWLELSAPSLFSYAQDVRYGEVQFDNATGLLAGPVHTIPIQPDSSGSYIVTLDNAAAGLLTIQP